MLRREMQPATKPHWVCYLLFASNNYVLCARGKAAENGGLLTLFSASFPHPIQGVSPAALNTLAAGTRPPGFSARHPRYFVELLGDSPQEQPVPGNDLLGVTATVTLKQINLAHDRKLICVV
jgi:hypothetical protein